MNYTPSVIYTAYDIIFSIRLGKYEFSILKENREATKEVIEEMEDSHVKR